MASTCRVPLYWSATLLGDYHQRAGGQLSDMMKHPDLAADFSNWHS
jgi:hypothetical protein